MTFDKSRFTVLGDAVPYQRMTQGQVKLMRIPDAKISAQGMKQKMRIRRYLEWKDWVNGHTFKMNFPRSPKIKVFLNVVVFFKNKAHADPENIRKGIQDAIFENDKMVAGSVDFGYDPDNPRCEIEIIAPKEDLKL